MSMIKPFSYSMAAVLLSSTSALAAACFDSSSTSCATVSGKTSDCLALGYSKDDVDVNCKHYLLCPFDTSYKACVTQKYADPCEDGYVFINGECVKAYASCEDAGWKYSSIPSNMHCDASTNIYLTNGTQKTCYSACSCNDGYVENASGECVKDCSGYPLTQCPTNGVCSKCISGSTTKYKLDSCKEGYKLSGNTCVADNKCDGYTLTQCPTNGICSECVSGSTTKYKLNSCEDGYEVSGNTCVVAIPEIRLRYNAPYLTCRVIYKGDANIPLTLYGETQMDTIISCSTDREHTSNKGNMSFNEVGNILLGMIFHPGGHCQVGSAGMYLGNFTLGGKYVDCKMDGPNYSFDKVKITFN